MARVQVQVYIKTISDASINERRWLGTGGKERTRAKRARKGKRERVFSFSLTHRRLLVRPKIHQPRRARVNVKLIFATTWQREQNNPRHNRHNLVPVLKADARARARLSSGEFPSNALGRKEIIIASRKSIGKRFSSVFKIPFASYSSMHHLFDYFVRRTRVAAYFSSDQI